MKRLFNINFFSLLLNKLYWYDIGGFVDLVIVNKLWVIYLKKVIKRKGNVEPFNPNKIKGSIQKATIDAGYTLDEKKNIINEVLTNINHFCQFKIFL